MIEWSPAERERIRTALRGRRLLPLARQLGVSAPTLENFVHGSAYLTPALLSDIDKLLAPPDKSKRS